MVNVMNFRKSLGWGLGVVIVLGLLLRFLNVGVLLILWWIIVVFK